MKATDMSNIVAWRDDLTFRIRLFAVLLFLLALCAFLLGLLSYGADSLLSFGIISLLFLILADSIILYFLASSRYAQIGVYVTLCLIVLLLALVDFFSGTLSGAMWVIYQATPPIALLVLRDVRAIVIMIAISLPVMLIVGALEIIGIIPVILLTTPEALIFNLCLQAIMMLVLGFIMYVISKRELTIMRDLVLAREEADHQLQRVNQLLEEQQNLNHELGESMRLMRESQEQLRLEQEQQDKLRHTISLLAAPVVPVLPGVVVIPLVGVFDHERLQALVDTILQGIRRFDAHTVVLDMTGMQSMDEELARTLLSVIRMMRLLGSKTVVVGISPEGAEALVSLGIDVNVLHAMPTLQEAILQIVQLEPERVLSLGSDL